MAKILIIEDSKELIEMLELLFKIRGDEIISLLDTETVRSKIDSFNPDLILLDVRLRGKDGREVCKEIKKTHKMIPIILMSANPKLLIGYEECEANEILEKPFDINVLGKKITGLLSLQNKTVTGNL